YRVAFQGLGRIRRWTWPRRQFGLPEFAAPGPPVQVSFMFAGVVRSLPTLEGSMKTAFVVIPSSGFALAADTPKEDAARRKLERARGVWKLVGVEKDG